MFERLRARKEWKFFAVLPRANRPLAVVWWLIVVLRGVLPAVFAIAMGVLVSAVQHSESLVAGLALVGAIFVLLQILAPIQQAVGANLGDRTAAWLYDRLTDACVRPPGMGHLENPELTSDLTVARDFDLGMTGPPLFISMDFIASGLVEMIGGLASAVVLAAYAWWAPILLAGAWLATHWLLRESAVWFDRNTPEVRSAQRDADYAYRLAVDPPASKELRLFGLAGWTIDRFVNRRTKLYKLQYEATRLRERPVLWSMLLIVGANVIVFWALAASAVNRHLDLGHLVMFAQSAIGTSMIAFGGLNWALDGAAAPVAAVLRLEPEMEPAGRLPSGSRKADGLPTREIRFRNVTFGYPGCGRVLEGFDLTIPAGTSLAIVGQNGAGKTTLAKIITGLYSAENGELVLDGERITDENREYYRQHFSAIFYDFHLFESLLGLEKPNLDDYAREGLARLQLTHKVTIQDGVLSTTQLSQGQRKRLALLTATLEDRPIYVFDEWAADQDREFREFFYRYLLPDLKAKGKMVLIICHDDQYFDVADRIIKLESGRIIYDGVPVAS